MPVSNYNRMADSTSSSLQLQHFTQNETRALHSLCKYYEDSGDASTAVICSAIINELGQTHEERMCMQRGIAIEDIDIGSSASTSVQSCLSILDKCKKLLVESKANDCGSSKDDEEQGKYQYHFIRIINEYREKCTDEGKYLLAKEFMAHDKNLRQELQLQQVELVQKRYNRDKSKLVAAHEQQAKEFKESWDKFMTAVEQKAQDHTSEVEEAHKQQLVMLEQSLSKENSNTNTNKPKKKWSKELNSLRERQILLAERQRYQEAQQVKVNADALEEKERCLQNLNIDTSLTRRTSALKKQQKAEMDVLAKRLENKRQKYVKQREEDLATLVQRNKNIQSTFDQRMHAECTKLASSIEQHVKKLVKGS